MIHYGCLLIRANDSGTAGVPGVGNLWAGSSTRLDGGSPRAELARTSSIAAYPMAARRRRCLRPGMPRCLASTIETGTYDLGAVEQDDIIFANMFGERPDN